jgi:phage regulator Rha-like protein
MSELVEVKKREIWADSGLVARKFGMQHKNLVRVIENVLNDYPDLRVITNDPKDTLRGI